MVGSTLSTTSRSSLVSLARYTSPLPPSPVLAVTEYGPMVPACSDMIINSLPYGTGTRSVSSWNQSPRAMTVGYLVYRAGRLR